VLEKDGEDQLGRSYEKLRKAKKNQGKVLYPTNNKNKEGYLDWSHLG